MPRRKIVFLITVAVFFSAVGILADAIDYARQDELALLNQKNENKKA